MWFFEMLGIMELTVNELVSRMSLKCVSGCEGLTRTISGVYVSDLLSDVVGHAEELQVWVTLHTHVNIVGVASLKNLSAIIITGNRIPDEETIKASEEQQIPILVTPLKTYELVGQIYQIISMHGKGKLNI